jgi:hypothetical protein
VDREERSIRDGGFSRSRMENSSGSSFQRVERVEVPLDGRAERGRIRGRAPEAEERIPSSGSLLREGL